MKQPGKSAYRIMPAFQSRIAPLLIPVTGFSLIIAWLFLGSAFNYSEFWQLITTLGTAVITFMVVWFVQANKSRKEEG